MEARGRCVGSAGLGARHSWFNSRHMPVPAVWGWATQGSPLALSAPGVGHENDTDLPQGCFNNWNPTVVGFIFVLIHIHILYLNF